MPWTVVTTFGTYVSSGKSSGGPTGSQTAGGRSNSAEPTAKPSAGSVNVATAMPPPTWTARPIARRRVTVSPSNAPGIRRSDVYLGFGCLRRGWGTCEAKIIDAALAGAAPTCLGRLVVRRRTVPDDPHARLPH